MKKYLSLLLALLLLLAGCANEEGEPTETTVPVETMPAGYYVENSQLESVTAGAVRQYALPGAEYKWIKCVGDRVLLAENSDPAQLCLLAEMAFLLRHLKSWSFQIIVKQCLMVMLTMIR